MKLFLEIKENVKITTPEDIYKYLEEFKDEDREYFIVIGLMTNNRVLYRDIVSIGVLDGAIVHPREVFKGACMKSAKKIIIAHNHPSGSLEPSVEDLELTRKLKEAGDILDIKVLDSIIISREGYRSL